MCLAIPGKVIELFPGQPIAAMVDVVGVRRKVDLGLLAGRFAGGGRLGADSRRLCHEQDQRGRRAGSDANLRMLGEAEQAMEEVGVRCGRVAKAGKFQLKFDLGRRRQRLCMRVCR